MGLTSLLTEGIDLSDSFGYIFISLVLTTALWGASVVQLYLYFERHARADHWLITIPLAAICVLDTVHQVTLVHLCYTHLIQNFADFIDLEELNFEGPLLIIVTAFIVLLVQGIFVMRVWTLGKHNFLLTGVCIGLVAAHFAITTAYFGMTLRLTSVFEYVSQGVFAVEIALNAIGSLTDAVIAWSLALLLYRARSPFKQTNSMIRLLILYFVSTGFMMDVCSLSALVTTVVYRESLIPLMILLIYPKLYVNSVFALLNSRRRPRNGQPTVIYGPSPASFPMKQNRSGKSLDSINTTVEFASASQIMEAKEEFQLSLPREIEVEVSVETQRFSRDWSRQMPAHQGTSSRPMSTC